MNNLSQKGFNDYKFGIIMPALGRNLHDILNKESIAGMDWTQIKRLFTDIVSCVSYLHQQHGIIHGDIKPLNIMRNEEGRLILIDLDASVSFIKKETIGHKISTAYSPPEILYIDSISDKVKIKMKNNNDINFSPIIADPSFDSWSLGVVLYQMVCGYTLFHSNSDNIDDKNLYDIFEWNDKVRIEKLNKISNKVARNLVSRLLNKDPLKRLLPQDICYHPFLSGLSPIRMIGDEPAFDVFLSYRVAADSDTVEELYNQLTNNGIKVWWDKKCLQSGVSWEEGFCNGLITSKSFVCLLSENAMFNINKQNFLNLNETSACDNVLLEHQIALEFKELGLLKYIFPIFIGNIKKNDYLNRENFNWSNFNKLPDINVTAVQVKLNDHFNRLSLGLPTNSSYSPKQTLEAIKINNGSKIEGNIETSINATIKLIIDM
jgi:serine/threonine protein kinase